MTISPQLDAVHRLIIECHRKYFEESPSPAKLQKLCFYAQGFSLAEGLDLFPEDFEAWQRGPSIPSLHQKYGDLDWRLIETQWSEPLEEATGYELVREVVGAYGNYDNAALTCMTHREAPWQLARGGIPDNEGCRAVISKNSMRASFKRWQHYED